MKQTLWTREFTRITAATALGAAGGIISQFALSFLVFDETGSTLAAALVVAIQLIPMVLLPLVVAPMMDRLPRKPFLVWGDLLNGVCYAGAGLFLLHSSFSYIAYLAFSLLVSCLGAFDELAYNSFYPLLLPKGQEERAYTVSAMLYPILKVLMMPLAAVLYEMTFFGFGEEAVDAERQKLYDSFRKAEGFDKLPPEERAKHFFSAEEVFAGLGIPEPSEEERQEAHRQMCREMLINSLRTYRMLEKYMNKQ